MTTSNVVIATATGAEIRRARTAAGMSQQALADRLGVSQPQISAWESGRLLPRWPQLLDIGLVLDVSPQRWADVAKGGDAA